MRKKLNMHDIKSPNYSRRSQSIQFIIIHYTEMTYDGALQHLCDPMSKVSSHYLIKDSGEIKQLVDNHHVAWHAGASSWYQFERLNECSIGIELDNLGTTPYTNIQLTSCIQLCQYLVKKYNIPQAQVLGHSDVAPNRKVDPGPFFPWSYLAKYTLGIWHDLDEKIISYYDKNILYQFGEESLQILQLQQNLQALGYTIEGTGVFDMQTNFVIRAFQLHFQSHLLKYLDIKLRQDNSTCFTWNQASQLILQNLLKHVIH